MWHKVIIQRFDIFLLYASQYHKENSKMLRQLLNSTCNRTARLDEGNGGKLEIEQLGSFHD